MRIRAIGVSLSFVFACGPQRPTGSGPDQGMPDAAMQPLDECAKQGLPPTRVSGTVYAPNGTLPLYGVNVYVPSVDPGPLPDGATCSRCDAALPGQPIVQTT